MINPDIIINRLSFLEADLIEEILKEARLEVFSKNSLLIREGQYIKYLPVILEGIVKVYSQFDEKELLLYYIKPSQSCIISFAAATYNQPSKIYAVTENDCQILLLPTGMISSWTASYPRFNQLFFDLYHERYMDLLDTINQLIFKSLDQRIYAYLIEKSKLEDSNLLNIRHHQIAKDLGTAREVVSRTIKKLEKEQKVEQTSVGIKILKYGDWGHRNIPV